MVDNSPFKRIPTSAVLFVLRLQITFTLNLSRVDCPFEWFAKCDVKFFKRLKPTAGELSQMKVDSPCTKNYG